MASSTEINTIVDFITRKTNFVFRQEESSEAGKIIFIMDKTYPDCPYVIRVSVTYYLSTKELHLSFSGQNELNKKVTTYYGPFYGLDKLCSALLIRDEDFRDASIRISTAFSLLKLAGQ